MRRVTLLHEPSACAHNTSIASGDNVEPGTGVGVGAGAGGGVGGAPGTGVGLGVTAGVGELLGDAGVGAWPEWAA